MITHQKTNATVILKLNEILNKFIIKKVIHENAIGFGIPEHIVYGICMTESSMNPLAIRYEPKFYNKYIMGNKIVQSQADKIQGISTATELYLRACSFGLMQVMGQVARELGFAGTFLTELLKPEIGVFFGCTHFQKKLKKYKEIPKAISAYNAGIPTDNRDYIESVLKHSKNYER